jgi:hypothetical protein
MNLAHTKDGVSDPDTHNLSQLIVRLHFKAYRAACNQIENAAVSVFQTVIQPPASLGVFYARKITLIDYCFTATLRTANHIAEKVLQTALFEQETLKTQKQIQREKEIALFRSQLGERTVYPKFCRTTATYINEAIPKIVGEKLAALPPFTEGWILYKMGISIRYLNYQIEKRTGYRAAIINSLFGKTLEGNFIGLRCRVAHLLTGKHNLEPLINFEHLLLNLCIKLTSQKGDDARSKRLMQTAIKSLGRSLGYQPSIETFLNGHPFHSKEEQMIGRLEWHACQGILPEGLPNPHVIALTPANLNQELDHALSERVEKIATRFLQQVSLESLNRGLLGAVYFLEGKDFLIQLLTYLTAEFGIKQLVDPHLFALAILYAGGVEVAEYELDGFGRGKTKNVVFTGQQMIKEHLKERSDWKSTQKIFDQSQLKSSPGSTEAILQRYEAKRRLRKFIASLIYGMIKGEELQYDSMLKGVRERASKLPIVGVATVSLHVLINGMFFSFGYLFRDAKQSETSYLSWLAKNFSGKKLSNYFADKVVDLIYHPSWRITLMQLIDDLLHAIDNPPPMGPPEETPPFKEEDLKPITDFLFQHFIKDSQIPFEGNIVPLIDYFTREGLLAQFRQLMRPSNDSLLEKALESLLPTMKELILYCRLVDAFRTEKVFFEGDQKFWEIFTRESLNRLTASDILRTKGRSTRISLAEISAIRIRHVDHLLKLNMQDLRIFLSDIPESSPMLDRWEVIPDESEPLITKHISSPVEIVWDYQGEQ